MKNKAQKPYFYFGYNPISDDVGYKAILLNIVTRRFKNLINFDLQDNEQLRRYSVQLQLLMNSVDLAQRVRRLDQMLQQLEVSFDIINHALDTDKKSTCIAYSEVVKKLSNYEEEVHYSRENYYETMKNKNSRPIKKFKSMFNYYNELYKDNYSIVSSFPAYCHGVITNDKRAIEECLALETKEKITTLSSPIILKKIPISLLTKGCNRHIRNAISHENRHIFLDDNRKVRLTDINPKGEVVYDKTFSIEEFEELLRDLMITISSLRCALAIFNINNVRKINQYAPRESYTHEEIEKIAFTCAKDSFFDYHTMKLNSKDDVSFVVKVQDRRKVKSVEISVGSLSKIVPIPEIPDAKLQLAKFLQLVFYNTGKSFKKMSVSLVDLENKRVGVLEVDTANFEIKDVNDFLKKATKDTIPVGYKIEK